MKRSKPLKPGKKPLLRKTALRGGKLVAVTRFPEPVQVQDGDELRIEVTKVTGLLPPARWGMAVDAGNFTPAPKPVEHRNPALLFMARNQRCLLRIPGVCNHRTDTTVACHSNFSEHGKAGARKADDCWTVWGCCECHRWLDQGRASYEEKRLAFDTAHRIQVDIWRRIVHGLHWDENGPFDRKAAAWALFLIDAHEKDSAPPY